MAAPCDPRRLSAPPSSPEDWDELAAFAALVPLDPCDFAEFTHHNQSLDLWVRHVVTTRPPADPYQVRIDVTRREKTETSSKCWLKKKKTYTFELSSTQPEEIRIELPGEGDRVGEQAGRLVVVICQKFKVIADADR